MEAKQHTTHPEADRRRFERYALPPMYSPVTIQRGCGMVLRTLEGHAYDISEGGLRIELDTALEPAEPVTFAVELPYGGGVISGSGTVVWVHDAEDDPGPRRCAIAVRVFQSGDDHQRLVRYLRDGLLRRAA